MTEHFFVIGAQRSGTTSLYDLLDEHPEIEMAKPRRPEPKFFLAPDAPERLDEYERTYFAGATARLRGEKSTTYLEAPEAAPRIRAAYPDARLVALLREPVERAVSNYWFTVGHGLEDRPIDVALDPATEPPPHDPERFSASPHAYLARGRYAELLRPWVDVFPRPQVGVFLLEELAPAEVYGFLGADPSFPPTAQRVNEAPRAAAPAPATVERLRAYYEAPNRELEELLGRPLPAWAA